MSKKKESTRHTKSKKDWTISVVRESPIGFSTAELSTLPRGSFAVAGTQADSKGNVIFADPEEVPQSKFDSGFSNCLEMATSMIARADKIGHNLEIDSITLKLSVNAKYGCSLIADAKIAGAIELKIKRRP